MSNPHIDEQDSESMEPAFGGTFDSRTYRPRGDNIPRVLLRGWHPGTAAAALGLNTDRGIYPFAWHFDVSPASRRPGASREPADVPPRLTDLTKGHVLALAAAHIGGDTETLSPFTSWSADLPTAVFFAMGQYSVRGWVMNTEPGHVAVVDLSRPHPIIHATDLGWSSLPMEYLVHGPVTQGLRVVSIAAIKTTLNCMLWPFCHAIILAASWLSWGQVPVGSPRPLGQADLLRAEQQQTRPWPAADVERILTSRLLVHNGAFPPLSGGILSNSLTSTEAWGSPAGDNTAGASQPRLTREQWEAAFKEAAYRHAPVAHSCGPGPFVCRECGESGEAATAIDYSRPQPNFCSPRCAAVHDLKQCLARADRAGGSP